MRNFFGIMKIETIFGKYKSFQMKMNYNKNSNEKNCTSNAKIWTKLWFSSRKKSLAFPLLMNIAYIFNFHRFACWNHLLHWKWKSNFYHPLIFILLLREKKMLNQYVYNEIIQNKRCNEYWAWETHSHTQTILFHQNSLEKFRHFKLFFFTINFICFV